MKVAAAKLSPLLKSDAQGLILAEIFMNPDEFFSISQLAEFAGTSLPTAMREVDRLLDGQLVIQKSAGRARFCGRGHRAGVAVAAWAGGDHVVSGGASGPSATVFHRRAGLAAGS